MTVQSLREWVSNMPRPLCATSGQLLTPQAFHTKNDDLGFVFFFRCVRLSHTHIFITCTNETNPSTKRWCQCMYLSAKWNTEELPVLLMLFVEKKNVLGTYFFPSLLKWSFLFYFQPALESLMVFCIFSFYLFAEPWSSCFIIGSWFCFVSCALTKVQVHTGGTRDAVDIPASGFAFQMNGIEKNGTHNDRLERCL